MQNGWQFWIDRGGTFTDIVAMSPSGKVHISKLLSENPQVYSDAAVHGIQSLINKLSAEEPTTLRAVKMGTTVGTNALLERKGDRVLLVTNKGFADALRIGYQNRPDIFALQILLPNMLYEEVVEVSERTTCNGETLTPLDLEEAEKSLEESFRRGIRSCAILLLHSYKFPDNERKLAALAVKIGFEQVSCSHEASPLIKFISRGDTTLCDAYLTPPLDRYIKSVREGIPRTRLMFMQSNGGLTDASSFSGKDSILSGPAGGLIGAIKTSALAGFTKIIAFDMGGTSTDVSHFNGELEHSFETQIAGVRLRSPILDIHTVAAGGGSILQFDGSRYRAGPHSAGAVPGPLSYRRGGPLTVTDANVMTGKIQPDFFPQIFGDSSDLPLNKEAVYKAFTTLSDQIFSSTGIRQKPEEIAEGFIQIAVTRMSNAIKHVSIQRGHDLTDYVLTCFGGAGGQHACLIADSLGIERILIHRLAGVLSALGIGMADVIAARELCINASLTSDLVEELQQRLLPPVTEKCRSILLGGNFSPDAIRIDTRVLLRYENCDFSLAVDWGTASAMESQFTTKHLNRYGFVDHKRKVLIDSVSVQAVGLSPMPEMGAARDTKQTSSIEPDCYRRIFCNGHWREAPLWLRKDLTINAQVAGPAIISDETSTSIVEPGWTATVLKDGSLLLSKTRHAGDAKPLAGTEVHARETGATSALHQIQGEPKPLTGTEVHTRETGATSALHQIQDLTGTEARVDPVKLELFNSLFMFVAEQMGFTLQNTSYSVNIKERLDFSCAIFDGHGNLVANAPHIPVHLGSMGESVKNLLQSKRSDLKPGDVYATNDPYNGGTHLPDITVITPVFEGETIIFFTASRGHHADVGGLTPGSMPPDSTTIEEEGILLSNQLIVSNGQLLEEAIVDVLKSNKYPARNPEQNLSDLKAQIAANSKGAAELQKTIRHWGLATVLFYMARIQDNAEECVRQAISRLQPGAHACVMDDGSIINVSIAIDLASRSATIDFSGTSSQHCGNLNAPLAVTLAAVLYVFRTLVPDEIPLNAGCFRPLTVIAPQGSMLNPSPPAAVVAGNVETSQQVVDALYAALGVMAASQGTMNNFTFGNQQYQYYETICGGSGAGRDFAGVDGIHTHMTNSRLTDPEVLESRYPVILESFAIRPDSGGTGKHAGGCGVIRKIRFREPMTASILSDRRQIAPHGLAGGTPGLPGRNTVVRADGATEQLGGRESVALNCGDAFVIETPGGGGYGSRTPAD